MNYKKYEVRSPLFALKDPRLSEAVIAAFAGVTLLPAPAPRKAAARVYHVKRAR
jgi:hypothetical protein